MESALIGLVAAIIGGLITVAGQRVNETWLKRRNTASDAYGAAVAVHSAVVSGLSFVRRVDASIKENPQELRWIAESSDWHLSGHVEATKARLEKLREAQLNIRASWGAEVARLFDDFFDLVSAWHNAFATFGDAIQGHVDPDVGVWNQDTTGFNWDNVISGSAPDAEVFEREFEKLMGFIREFARSAGIAITELLALPQGVREVVSDYEQHRQRFPLALPEHPARSGRDGG